MSVGANNIASVIDTALLRENPDNVRRSQEARGSSPDTVDRAIEADQARRDAITRFETLRAEQNAAGKEVAKAKGDEKTELLGRVKELAASVKEAQQKVTEAEAAFTEAMSCIGNIVLEGVPAGGEKDFVTLRTVGEKPAFDFEPKDHLDIAEGLRAIDMQRGAKVSGARFYYLTGVGARLEIALMNLGLQRALQYGLTPIITPTLVKPEAMEGTGFLGNHASEVYFLPEQELYLTGTSEVALAAYHSDEIIDVTEPQRYAGWSTCYRSEAGSYGKDTRGIIRVHQFNKIEMFSFVDPAIAADEHERMLGMQEEMMRDLGLSYRVIDTAAGDLGSSAARKFDIEAWVPTQNAYRELTSTSNCTTFQARRLGIRYRTESGKTAPVATLNGTLATTRWIVAILETHQQADGSVIVPDALRPFLGIDVLEPVA